MTWKKEQLKLQDTLVDVQRFAKSTSSKGLLVFGSGFSSLVEHYMGVLNPLTEIFDIIALYNRGHGDNKERFDAKKLSQDLIALQKQEPVDFYLGHSVGCSMDSNVPTFMINPYLGNEFASSLIKLGTQTGNILSRVKLNVPIEYLVNKLFIKEKTLLNNYHFIRDASELTKVKAPKISNDLCFVFSSNDEVIGTHKSKQFYNLINKMYSLYDSPKNASLLGYEKNHNLNDVDMVRFLSDVPYEESMKTANTIADFYLNN